MEEIRNVIDVSELPELLHCGFFGHKWGRNIGRWLLKALGIEEINNLVRRHGALSGADFASAVLEDPAVQIRYDIEGEANLRRMAEEESFITVSNHPFGGLDGLLLVSIIGAVRKDFKVVVNDILNRVQPLRDSWISVSPSRSINHEAGRNISPIIEVARRIKGGHPVGFFPSGTVAKYHIGKGKPVERSWSESSMRIFRALQVPVYPVAFSGRNSIPFYILQTVADTLHGLRLPAEILNKKGQVIHVTIGEPLTGKDFDGESSLSEIAARLRSHTLKLVKR